MTASIEQTLQLKQVLDTQMDDIVQLAENVWTESRVNQFKGSLGQLNNAIGVAVQAESPRVVSAWIAYQMGRRETSKKWDDSGLGTAILQHFADLDARASGIAKQVYMDDSPEHHRHVAILLIRNYLGFLKRWFVAKGGQKA